MKPISADSHVVEGRDVFTGLAERFGDEAPRIMDVGDQVNAIVVPARGLKGVSVARMGMAATRLARNEPLKRKPGRKPDVAHMQDPELVALFSKGYAGMRKGLVDGAHRFKDQDVDGLAAEFLYPGFFGMFSLANTALLVALQKNYNDWLHDYASAANGRLFGLAAIPVQDPDAATAELDRVIKLGFKGGCIPCTSPAERPYFDDAYEPIWARAEEAGFPLSMHVGTNAHVPKERRVRPWRPDAIADYAASQARCSAPSSSSCAGACANGIRTCASWWRSSTPAGSPTGWTASIKACNGSAATWPNPTPARRPTRSGAASSTPPSKTTAQPSPPAT